MTLPNYHYLDCILQIAPRINNNSGNTNNSDSNSTSVIIIRFTESQACAIGLASESVAGAVRRSRLPLQQAFVASPHARPVRPHPNYRYLDCILARSEGRHLLNIAYYMKGGINRNESEGEQAVFDM